MSEEPEKVIFPDGPTAMTRLSSVLEAMANYDYVKFCLEKHTGQEFDAEGLAAMLHAAAIEFTQSNDPISTVIMHSLADQIIAALFPGDDGVVFDAQQAYFKLLQKQA